ncbi:hypothetical protein [Microbacterium sp.]|uniref:hypothetical protein n=1 Tax=Microbacterium sp. TaxID=51671 RepID=UPI002BEEB125|nr:hypothetical protein [Microbacterium sp.]HWK78716.1 hypothetical protein [Microbacterium sp.]
MNKTSLTRSIPYWLLLVLSVVAVAFGGWLVWDNTTTMQTTLLDGTATNVEVYVGQAWITAGAAILAAGVIGVLLTLALGAVKSLLPASAPVVVEPIEWTAQDDVATETSAETTETASDASPETDSSDEESEGQNGSSGSIATATKISVK